MSNKPKLAHRVPGRIRIKLPNELPDNQAQTLIRDLKVSPEIRSVTLRGSSLIIEHNEDDEVLTGVGAYLSKFFPSFEQWSDELDAQIAKTVADPWVNKSVPLLFVGLAVYRGVCDGAILAGESAFALAYVAFDLYWKFQQENVIRKIEKGLSQKDLPKET